jgi:hypothetical protein
LKEWVFFGWKQQQEVNVKIVIKCKVKDGK